MSGRHTELPQDFRMQQITLKKFLMKYEFTVSERKKQITKIK